MAAPNYTTDLTTINTAEAITGWAELTGATAGLAPVAEADYFIQGTYCISKPMNATGLGSVAYDNGVGVTIPTDGAYMAWIYFGAPNAVATEANGGMRLAIGNTIANYKMWYVRGSDTYAYGGWICVPVDPTVTADATYGSPTSTLQFFGYVTNTINAIAKGNPFAVDVIRYGRCEARMNGGDLANGYATFTGYATQNDTTTNRWGLIQAVSGGYQAQGLVVLGYTSAVDFRDSNTAILIANTKKVSANFNTFEVRQATSRVDWTNISFLGLGTVSRGNFITTDDADINITGCTFTDMGTFGFLSNGAILTSTFRRCNLVTQSSAVFTSCTFDSTNDSVKALLSNNPANISSCSFLSSGTKHAIELNTAGTYSFSGNTFTGYATTDGSTGNECIYNNSAGAVTLNITNGGNTPTIRNGAGASTTVNNAVTITITVKDESGANIENARVAVYKSSDMTELMNSLTNASGVATASFNYVSDTVVIIRVRKSSAAPKYVAVNTSGTIISTGLTATVTFVAETIAASTTNGTIASEFTINTTTKTIKHASGTTVYSANALYTWLMDYFDDIGLMDDTIPMTAQTPTEYALTSGWFMDNNSFKYLNGGAIQTSGQASYNIHILTVTGGTYADPVAGDITKTVVAGATSIGPLVDYEIISAGVSSKWYVRDTRTTPVQIASTTAMTITTGTGSGNNSANSLTGENIWSNIFTLGSLVSGTTLNIYQNDTQITPWWSSGHIDVLVKVKEAGTEIDSGNLTVLARKYSTLYDHYIINASTGRNPVPLAAFTDSNNITAEGTVGVAPYTNITFDFGYYSGNLNNGNGAQPYDVVIDCATLTVAQVYEYLKYVTRTGSATILNGVNGEFYTAVGDIRLNYISETSGPFVEGSAITSSAGGSGYIVSLINNGTTGTLVIRNVHGTFADTNTLTSGSTTAAINGTPDIITQSKQAPFGTFAGGKFFGARGVWITNYAGSDGNNFTLIDSTGTTQAPPSTISITVNSIVSGDQIGVYRTTGDNEIVDKSVYVSHNTANTSGLSTFTVTTTIAADTPSIGNLRVVNRNASGNIIDEQSYAYVSWTGMVFTLSGTLSQTYNSDDTAYVPYIDVTASSTTASVSFAYATNRYIVTRVRKKGIVPFAVKGQLTNANLTITAIRTSDSIVT